MFGSAHLISWNLESVPWTMTFQFLQVFVEGVFRQLTDKRGRRDGLVLREVLAPTSSEKVFLFT